MDMLHKSVHRLFLISCPSGQLIGHIDAGHGSPTI